MMQRNIVGPMLGGPFLCPEADSAISPIFTIIAMVLCGVTSERAGDRLQHIILLFRLAALGWTIIALSATQKHVCPGRVSCSCVPLPAQPCFGRFARRKMSLRVSGTSLEGAWLKSIELWN
jgi:hypothetical protein